MTGLAFPGLYLHRASRVEALAERLARTLERERPLDPLASQTVLVAHPGLRHWLLGWLARRPGRDGSGGIAANLDLRLPGEWLEHFAAERLGANAGSTGYARGALRWRIFARLATTIDPELQGYLAGDATGRRRFQLADRLAAVYGQYVVYRPDWLAAWERGAATGAPAHWQGPLWRSVSAELGGQHRARRAQQLLDALQRDPAHGEPLHVFGVNHLPPDLLHVLRLLGRQRAVHLYFPDPCREHWDYLRSMRAVLQAGDAADALYLEIGHPLLAALGRMGQQFAVAAAALDPEIDQRDPGDERDAEDDAALPLLHRLQHGIRMLEPEFGARTPAEAAAALDDASLRAHACHTRLRELEVLKDALLRMLATDRTLQPRDIVVMAPRIADYAPLLPAVFGAPARFAGDADALPYHLADVAVAATHPLYAAFAQLLDLDRQRYARSWILGLFDLPAVARRHAVDRGERDALARWLMRARVAWGLDAQNRQASGAAAVGAHTWRYGLDRMFAGLLLGDDVDDELLLDGIAPVAAVDGPDAQVLGSVAQLIARLQRAHADIAQPRTAHAWGGWLLQLIDDLFAAAHDDAAEVAALKQLRQIASAPGVEAGDVDVAVPWHAIREAWLGALNAVPERQPFLAGGITFCGMVPQRTIPFRVVCVLGLNDGEFPRQPSEGGLNLMTAHPRAGDRDVRWEDRYLFLEALMAARDALHLSWLGADPHSGRARPPATPLAELLGFLDALHGIAEDDPDAVRPWRVAHALQPFDARYFDASPARDPRLHSYHRRYVDADPQRAGRSEPAPFAPAALDAAADDPQRLGATLDLDSLLRFWRRPIEQQLRHGARVRLVADVDDGDREPLDAAPDRRERLDRRLLFDAVQRGARELPDNAPAWLQAAGFVPVGTLGDCSYAKLRRTAAGALALCASLPGFPFGRSARPHALEIDVDGRVVAGVSDRLWIAADGTQWLFDVQLGRGADFRELLPLLIEYACLRLAAPAAALRPVLIDAGGASGRCRLNPVVEAFPQLPLPHLREALRVLIRLRDDAYAAPLWFPPATAWAYADTRAQKDAAHAERAAHAAWRSDPGGEALRAPGYEALFARDADFLAADSAVHAQFTALAQRLHALLVPQDAR